MSACQGCGTELPPSRGPNPRKWCSDRCRKQTLYAGTCVDCGTKTAYQGRVVPSLRCGACALKRAHSIEGRRERSACVRGNGVRWSNEDMLDAIRSVAVDGFVSRSRYRAIAARNGLPTDLTIEKRLGWAQAVEMAGCRTRSNSRLRADRTPALGVINALQDCAAELGRMPTYVEYSAWAQRVGATGPQTVRNRFGGSWMAAIEAAIADEALAA